MGRSKKKTAVLVLGMHRSGTSVITRGVHSLGFTVGDNMLLAKDDNKKGFWEDKDILDLDERYLATLGASWDTPLLVTRRQTQSLPDTVYAKEIRSLLATKYSQSRDIVIKEPRISLLTTLWREQLKLEGYSIKEILCLRHPRHVAESLNERNQFSDKKSYHLWYSYNQSILAAASSSLLVVCFEQLIENPQCELVRIADYLGVDRLRSETQESINLFADEFVERALVHQSRSDTQGEQELEFVSALYEQLRLACDAEPLSRRQCHNIIKSAESKGISARVDFEIDVLCEELRSKTALTHEMAQDVHGAKQEVVTALRDKTILGNAVDEIRKANDVLRNRNSTMSAEIASSRQKETEAQNSIAKLRSEMRRLESQNSKLHEELGEFHDSAKRFRSLITMLTKNNTQLLQTNEILLNDVDRLTVEGEHSRQHIGHLDLQIRALERSVEEILSSLSWKLTAPIRMMVAPLFAVFRLFKFIPTSCELTPIHDVSSDLENSWCLTGKDPQFEVIWARGKLHPGWYDVSLQAINTSDDITLTPRLYFDYGDNFVPKPDVHFASDRQGYRALFKLSKHAHRLRLDPCESQGSIGELVMYVKPVSSLRVFIRGLREVWASNRASGKTIREVLSEKLLQLRREGVFNVLRNMDHYVDFNSERHTEGDFLAWIEKYEPRDTDVETRLAQLNDKPLISIVVPVYNTPIEYLTACIESVVAQYYPNWELCIANDHSSDEEIPRLLNSYTDSDKRIKVRHLDENVHISAATNAAIALASGDYIGFLDHDDELAPNALLEVVSEINRSPESEILYSDEDKIDEQGVRFAPHFKTEWNRELLFSQNYICHFMVIKSSLVSRVGGLRVGFEGSQDYDLVLRCVLELVDEQAIKHIPKLLYHWRAISGSTALAATEKSYTADAGLKAVGDAIENAYPGCSVEFGLVPHSYRVRYPVPNPEPKVSLIIPTRDKVSLLRKCIESIIERTDYGNYEIVVVDNNSVEEKSLQFFAKISQRDNVRVLDFRKTFNYSAINNFAMEHVDGDIVGLVNNDIEVISKGWMTELVSHAIREDVGCVGAKLYYGNDTIQHAGVILGIGGVAGHGHKYFAREDHGYFSRLSLVQNVSAVTGACLFVRRDVYMEIGGLNEEELAVAFNDVDFCLRVRSAGYKNIWTPYAELYHHESLSRGAEDTDDKRARFQKEVLYMKDKWHQELEADPYYSPNLTLKNENFGLRE